jgi:hypothetical protein
LTYLSTVSRTPRASVTAPWPVYRLDSFAHGNMPAAAGPESVQCALRDGGRGRQVIDNCVEARAVGHGIVRLPGAG